MTRPKSCARAADTWPTVSNFISPPASAEVQAKSESNGDWKTLLDAGAIPLPPGCGTCIGLGRGLVGKGEVAISATNRNFKGRMGDREALVYLGSPAVVAASALAGFICAPQTFTERPAGTAIRRAKSKPHSSASVEIIDGFPSSVSGRVLFLDKDNLNTDGIYGSKHTYRDDMTPEEMAAVTFENYDPNFNTLYQNGDVVVGGLNFGTGSSREQAATALKFKGIPCVIAAQLFRNLQAQRVQQRLRRLRMSRIGDAPARDAEGSRADDGGLGDHDRLRQIDR